MKDDKLYLIHISECIARIETYLSGGRETFMDSTLVQDYLGVDVERVWEIIERDLPDLKERIQAILQQA